MFTAQHLLEDGVAFRMDMRERAAAHGRDPDTIKILPGILPVLGATEAEAWARKKSLDDAIGLGPELKKLAARVGLPVEVMELDKPFPVHLLGPDAEFSGSIGFRKTLVNLAIKEKLTVRELVARYGGGHQQVVGTPEQLADTIEQWLKAGGADGFNLMVDVLPSGFGNIVDMLVPELQRRGMSGFLKNVLDYLQGLAQDAQPYIHNKAVGCIVSAAGWQAGATVLASMRSTVHALRGWPTPLGVVINSSLAPFGADGTVADAKVGTQLEILAGQVVEFARARTVTFQ